MSNVYFVFQKPESAYHDLPFERYDFPVSIPNGRNLTTGDLVVFDLTSKGAYFDCPLCGERNDIEENKEIITPITNEPN